MNDNDLTPDEQGPFGLPISMRFFYCLQVLGFVISLILMGLLYEVTQTTLFGPLSVPEVIGIGFFVVWDFGLFGPRSPFRT